MIFANADTGRIKRFMQALVLFLAISLAAFVVSSDDAEAHDTGYCGYGHTWGYYRDYYAGGWWVQDYRDPHVYHRVNWYDHYSAWGAPGAYMWTTSRTCRTIAYA